MPVLGAGVGDSHNSSSACAWCSKGLEGRNQGEARAEEPAAPPNHCHPSGLLLGGFPVWPCGSSRCGRRVRATVAGNKTVTGPGIPSAGSLTLRLRGGRRGGRGETVQGWCAINSNNLTPHPPRSSLEPTLPTYLISRPVLSQLAS